MKEYTWICLNCGKELKNNGTIPNECPYCAKSSDDSMDFYPKIANSRVHGDKYTPYPETTTWSKKANQVLKEYANHNFLLRRGRQA